MAKEFVKCFYPHCKHGGEQMKREDAVKYNNHYYHPDCFKEREELHEIEQYYIENFESEPIMSLLRKMINDIVFKRKYSTEYVLFALKYAKANNIPLKHPQGMVYIMKNSRVKSAWDYNQKQKDLRTVAKTEFKVEDNLTKVGGYGSSKSKGFGRILHGA